jgi:hypothetical protein
VHRRAFLLSSLQAFAIYALLRETRAAAADMNGRLAARRWVARHEDLARSLRQGSISRLAWQEDVARLTSEVDVEQLLAEIRASRLRDAGEPFMRDPRRRNVSFLDDSGKRLKLPYTVALFSFGPQNVITPHAHKHMVSAHLVVEGKVRIRTFNRLADEDGALIIRPTGDRVAGIGETAAMSSARDNIHWFVPRSERAATLDVIISGLDPGRPAHEIEPIDPLGGERRADGSIRAPRLSFEESMRRYSPEL